MELLCQMYASETVLDPCVAFFASEEQKKRDENGIDFCANCLSRLVHFTFKWSVASNPTTSQTGGSMQELAEQVKADFGTIDILVHSLANGPEVKIRMKKNEEKK